MARQTHVGTPNQIRNPTGQIHKHPKFSQKHSPSLHTPSFPVTIFPDNHLYGPPIAHPGRIQGGTPIKQPSEINRINIKSPLTSNGLKCNSSWNSVQTKLF
ncbi:hypothetical protein L6164_008496 [Bauhinia variegata]|uniref:Uncharacterized protein n=1 Tax=Bauhinia variegata TaxID=167791 RepID=A0ACB9PFX5_BAUVA|nr:hypothetical protein L6164_008496 [Bauhinia variegata]